MKRMDIKGFWTRTDTLLKAKGLTYVALCSKCESVNLTTLYNNRSKEHYPSVEDILQIADALETSLDWLLFGTEKKVDLSESELQSVQFYLNAPKDVKDIVDKVLRGLT